MLKLSDDEFLTVICALIYQRDDYLAKLDSGDLRKTKALSLRLDILDRLIKKIRNTQKNNAGGAA